MAVSAGTGLLSDKITTLLDEKNVVFCCFFRYNNIRKREGGYNRTNEEINEKTDIPDIGCGTQPDAGCAK